MKKNTLAMPNDKVAEWLKMWLHAIIDPAIVAPAKVRLAQADFADWIEGQAEEINLLARELSRLQGFGLMRTRLEKAPREVVEGLFLRAMLVCAELCNEPGVTLLNAPPDVRQAVEIFLGRDWVQVRATPTHHNN